MSTHETDDRKITYEDSPEAHKAAYDTLLRWFTKHDMYSGECLGQSDTTYVEGPNLLAELADEVFKFQVEWKD